MNERVILAAVLMSLGAGLAARGDEKPIDIGSRRELFVSRFLIGKLDRASLVLHEPRDEGEVLRFDQPWEGLHAGYCTVLRDGKRFRAYYRGCRRRGATARPTR